MSLLAAGVGGAFSTGSEETADFGQFIEHEYSAAPGPNVSEWMDNALPVRSRGPFKYNGMQATSGDPLQETVAEQRAKRRCR